MLCRLIFSRPFCNEENYKKKHSWSLHVNLATRAIHFEVPPLNIHFNTSIFISATLNKKLVRSLNQISKKQFRKKVKVQD